MSEKRCKPAAMLFVFTVSAVVHEYILAVCFGFFYPVLFCLFMCFGSNKLCRCCLDEKADKPSTYFIASFVYYTFIFLLPAVMFNFILHDQRKGPIWNIIMWTSLFLGHGVIICLYSQEWYAQQYCPIKEVRHGEIFCSRCETVSFHVIE